MRQVHVSLIAICALETLIISDAGYNANEMFTQYYSKTKSLECYGNPDMLVNVTCRLKPINWEKTIAIMDSDLVGLVNNISLKIELFKYTNQFRPFLLNFTLDVCKVFETGKGNAYGKWILNIFSYYTNVNHSCPYSGHLAARDIFLDHKLLPFVVPSGTYKMIMTPYDGWPMVLIGRVEVIVSVIKRASMPKTKPKVPNRVQK